MRKILTTLAAVLFCATTMAMMIACISPPLVDCRDSAVFRRLLELMADTQDLDSHQMIDMLKSAVEAHRNGAEPNDDLTLLAIHYAI